MATYAIGDIQGCYSELLELLDTINFNEHNDILWFTGDIVNRGPESLEALRFVKAMNAVIVLGNHDLHMLAISAGKAGQHDGDTVSPVLDAPDSAELLSWLKRQPLIHQDKELGYSMVHAGLPAQWDISDAVEFAAEVEAVLQDHDPGGFFSSMYGNQPDLWYEDLAGFDRLRFITNCFTRIRFCARDGRLDLTAKGIPGTQPDHLVPWYCVDGRKSRNDTILFGHWATVSLGRDQEFDRWNVIPLDTGCVWGRELTAVRLEDRKFFKVPSRQPVQPFPGNDKSTGEQE